MSQITETQISEYEAKKANIEAQIQAQTRDKIIYEEQLNQLNAQLLQNFNTTDPDELAKIADGYQLEITKLETELQQLELASE
jgi:inner membrane protein involved in colicin E2 resistance